MALGNSFELMGCPKALDNLKKQTLFGLFLRKDTDIYSVWCGVTAGNCTMSVKEFLKQRAVNIAVGGQYTLSNWFDSQGKPRTFACRTSRVSPFRMLVAVPVVGKVGDHITSYFGDFGKLEGEISDTTARNFLLELAMTPRMREKFASSPGWKGSRRIPLCPTAGSSRASSRQALIRL